MKIILFPILLIWVFLAMSIVAEVAVALVNGLGLPDWVWLIVVPVAFVAWGHLVALPIYFRELFPILWRWIAQFVKREKLKSILIRKVYGMRSFLNEEFRASDGITLKNPAITADLKAWSKRWRPFDETNGMLVAHRSKPDELFSDAISGLLNNPDALHEQARYFTAALYTSWPTKHQESYEAYAELRNLMKESEVSRPDRVPVIFRISCGPVSLLGRLWEVVCSVFCSWRFTAWFGIVLLVLLLLSQVLGPRYEVIRNGRYMMRLDRWTGTTCLLVPVHRDGAVVFECDE